MITSMLNGVRVYADECSDRNADYRCPECGEHLILAKGSYKIPHFKHEAHTACEYSGETIDHLKAKAWLYKNLKRRPDVEIVEAECTRFNGIRPDVAFLFKGKWIGFEIQHSGISQDEIVDRLNKYRENNVYCLWVATQKTYNKLKKCDFVLPEVRLSKQDLTFIRYHGCLVVFSGNSLVAFRFVNAVREREEYYSSTGYTGKTYEEELKTVFVPTMFCRVRIDNFTANESNYSPIAIRIRSKNWDDFDFFEPEGGI